jgi:GT2 family glycosyltransferase
MCLDNVCPKFFTVILNYNGEVFTDNCLAALNKINYLNHTIIVIDDCSKSNEIINVVNKYPGVLFRRNAKNLNYCKSFNRGINMALSRGAEYVFVVNNDTKGFSSNFITSVIEEFKSDSNVGIVGTECYDFDGRVLRNETGSIRFGFNMVVPTEGYVLSRKALETVGGFNEKLVIYMEDLDLLKRLEIANYKFGFAKKAKFEHYCGATTSSARFKLTFMRSRNICLFARHYLKELPKKEMLKQIIKNAGSPIKTALSEFSKGHLVSPTKRILAVVIGLMVGLIMDTKKIFK